MSKKDFVETSWTDTEIQSFYHIEFLFIDKQALNASCC